MWARKPKHTSTHNAILTADPSTSNHSLSDQLKFTQTYLIQALSLQCAASAEKSMQLQHSTIIRSLLNSHLVKSFPVPRVITDTPLPVRRAAALWGDLSPEER